MGGRYVTAAMQNRGSGPGNAYRITVTRRPVEVRDIERPAQSARYAWTWTTVPAGQSGPPSAANRRPGTRVVYGPRSCTAAVRHAALPLLTASESHLKALRKWRSVARRAASPSLWTSDWSDRLGGSSGQRATATLPLEPLREVVVSNRASPGSPQCLPFRVTEEWIDGESPGSDRPGVSVDPSIPAPQKKPEMKRAIPLHL